MVQFRVGRAGNDNLRGDVHVNNVILGLAGDDTLTGGNFADLLVGGAGNDTLRGRGGNDRLVGDSGDDTLFGGNGKDILIGGRNNDTLAGEGGNDVLIGGANNDIFLFNTALGASNRDVIIDFDVAVDTIWLDDAVFTGLGAGALSATAFHVGALAADAADRVIYDAETGVLYFTPYGADGDAQIQFATISAGLALTAADFVVI